ncbi:MAG: DUF4173 domain-containing protein [Chloroflexi bacterium]|nr:DUF4173 domain-containing protein [Chloroflexota bacterium]
MFYNKALGISFPIFILLCALVLLILLFAERVTPALSSLWLLAPMIVFASFVFVRAEPLTTFVNVMITFALGGLLVRTIYHGELFRFGLIDHLVNYVLLGVETLFRPFPFLWDVSKQAGDKESGRKIWLPIVRGLILVTPILCIFAVLLSAADLVFADRVRDVLKWLNLDNIPELIARGILILMATFAAIGLLVQAVRPFGKHSLIGAEKPIVPTLLGLIESSIVLGGINLLFAGFVIIQFRYLFGSVENITETGYTYSEYARRGFGELVLVVAMTLGILLALSTLVKREDRKTILTFNALNFLMVALVGVMVVSALQRLLLYESIFGFSRLRTYAHVATIWLGVLFVPYIVALLAGRMRWFATGTLFVVMGFGVTLNLLNVDQFIAQQNIARDGIKLHTSYLVSLSDDVVPDLIALIQKNKEENLGAGLACRVAQMKTDEPKMGWQSYHLARARAFELLKVNENLLTQWQVDKQNYVMVNGKRTLCRTLLASYVLEPGLTSEYR